MGPSMRRLVFSIAVGIALLGSSTSQAGVLVSATWTQVVAPYADQPAFLVSETLTGLGATGTSTATSINVALTFPAFTESLFLPGGAVDRYALLTQGGPQVIQATAGMASVDGAIPGRLTVWTATAGGLRGPLQLLYIPLAHGQAGQRTGYQTVLGSYGYFTVDFYAW